MALAVETIGGFGLVQAMEAAPAATYAPSALFNRQNSGNRETCGWWSFSDSKCLCFGGTSGKGEMTLGREERRNWDVSGRMAAFPALRKWKWVRPDSLLTEWPIYRKPGAVRLWRWMHDDR